MNASTNTVVSHLADVAQALGLDHMRALTAELSARLGDTLEARASRSPAAEHMRDLAEKARPQAAYIDAAAAVAFSAATFDASLPRTAWATVDADKLSETITLNFDTSLLGETISLLADRMKRNTEAAGDFSRTTFSATKAFGEIRHVEVGTINHLQPGDRLTFKAPSGHPLFTVAVERKR